MYFVDDSCLFIFDAMYVEENTPEFSFMYFSIAVFTVEELDLVDKIVDKSLLTPSNSPGGDDLTNDDTIVSNPTDEDMFPIIIIKWK